MKKNYKAKTIYLVGYMGSGKSTIGLYLAKLLSWNYIDTDLFIENRFRKKIVDIFATEGENSFRKKEKNIIEELEGIEDTVVATGGGLACYYNNMELMNRSGLTIYLQHSYEILAKRLDLCKRSRPSIKDKNYNEILEKIHFDMSYREQYYRQAHFIFNAEDASSVDKEKHLAMEILKKISMCISQF